MARELEEVRQDIDNIDKEIVELFKQRMDASLEIAQYKEEHGLPVADSSREDDIFYRVSEQLGPQYDTYGRLLYSTIFDVSRSYQNRYMGKLTDLADKINYAVENTPKIFPSKAVVACQGIAGANSHAACKKIFDVPSVMFFNSFEGVFSAVENGLCQYGILPIENSSYGSVGAVYDLMRNYDFHIVRSVRMHVTHNLMAKPGVKLSDVKEIYSHEQSIGQCGEFLRGLKGVKITTCENTAIAARMVAESDRRDIAAIASDECLGLYGLELLKQNIQTNDNNYTRFICISKDLEIYPGANKMSLILTVDHVPRSLYLTLARFAALGINLTKLESRPMPGSDFDFMFYFDLDASPYSPDLIKLLCELDSEPRVFDFLGCYTETV